MKRAVIYGRVSTKDQNTENQLRELRKVAKNNGWKITREYIDHGSVVPRAGISVQSSTAC